MARHKRAARDDSSSDEEVDVDQMYKTKLAIDKIREDRRKKRADLEKALDKRLGDLRKRIKDTVEAHTQQLGDINKQQVERLKQAVLTRDNIHRLICEKLAEMQSKAEILSAQLDKGYQHRLNKAQALLKEQPQGQGAARQAKRVKIDTSST